MKHAHQIEITTINPYKLNDETALILSDLISSLPKPTNLRKGSIYTLKSGFFLVKLTHDIKILKLKHAQVVECIIAPDQGNQMSENNKFFLMEFDPVLSAQDHILTTALNSREDLICWDNRKAYITKFFSNQNNTILRLTKNLVKTSEPKSCNITYKLEGQSRDLISFYSISLLNMTTEMHDVLVNNLTRAPENRILDKVNFLVGQNRYLMMSNILMKDEASDKENPVYHVICNNPLGSGGNSTVYKIVASLQLSSGNLQIIPWRDLVVKVLNLKTWENLDIAKRYARNEYEHSRKLEHISAQRPILDGNKVYMIMNLIPGMELLEVLSKVALERLSSSFRFKCSISLLEAYKQQVLALNITHFDIKPENIMARINDGIIPSDHSLLEFNPSQIEFNIIDYCYARPFNSKVLSYCGSIDYASNQMVRGIGKYFQDEKPDIHSLGICLKIIWGFLIATEVRGNIITNEEMQITYANLYTKLHPSLSLQLFMRITDLINNMTNISPKSRYGLRESLEVLKNIFKDYQSSQSEKFFGLKNKSGSVFFSDSSMLYANNVNLHTYVASTGANVSQTR